MVLKFPFTSAASANGLDRYRGLAPAPPGEGGSDGGPIESLRGGRFPVGVGDLLPRGARFRLECHDTSESVCPKIQNEQIQTQRKTLLKRD